MRRLSLFAALALACGGPEPAPEPLPEDGIVRPGVTYVLPTALSAGSLTWAITEGASCGSISGGTYTAPGCSTLPLTCHLVASYQGTSGNPLALTVQDRVRDVYDCVVVGATCVAALTVDPLSSSQPYARVRTFCLNEWSPALPAGVTCPGCPT